MHRRECPAQRWQPANREPYFLISADGEIRSLQWNDTLFDHAVWRFGNCFREWQEAKQARDDMQEYFARFHRKLEAEAPPYLRHYRPSEEAQPTASTGVALTSEQDALLVSLFWLALGCALGWQEKECYEGERPEALLETLSAHV